MASKAAQKRLTKEYVTMQKEPPPFVWAIPDEKNILTWNYLIRGPPDSPYDGGEYHGVILFPPEYPFKPPGIKMITPSGRFQPDKKICFSMSDFHPGSWNPAWSVATILTGLLSFMLSDEMTTGSITSADSYKRLLASRSHAWNLAQPKFKEAFPDYCTSVPKDLPNMGERERGKAEPPATIVATAVSSPSVSPSISLATQSRQPLGLTTRNTSCTANSPSSGAMMGGATGQPTEPSNVGKASPIANGVGPNTTPTHWTASWRQLIWEKWRWGLLIALAVVVSRITSS